MSGDKGSTPAWEAGIYSRVRRRRSFRLPQRGQPGSKTSETSSNSKQHSAQRNTFRDARRSMVRLRHAALIHAMQTSASMPAR